ncbi:MAG: Fic family protein [Candidatus Izemoplasmatales bacterium]|nr:Fic family protein [Candidatus Izemoplasmatales bacterium]
MYKPPFTITNAMLNYSISISQKIEKIFSYQSLKRMPTLRRNNRIKSIHSSLAIEANSLSLDQVRDVIDGHSIIGPQKEISEVKDACEAYEMINKYDGFEEKDLLKAHGIIARSIDEEYGRYRNHPEGVIDGQGNVIHIAPSEKMVPSLMGNLFDWLKKDKDTALLIKSCVFHYELIFIHPFGDGNGRMARLWQNVLLMKWNNLFEYIPIESRIYKYQNDYYESIDKSNKSGNSNLFIEFMLKMIDETIGEVLKIADRETKNISEQVNRLLEVMEPNVPLSANEIMRRLGIKSKETLRGSYLSLAIENGLVKMTIPDKPSSKNQKYYR